MKVFGSHEWLMKRKPCFIPVASRAKRSSSTIATIARPFVLFITNGASNFGPSPCSTYARMNANVSSCPGLSVRLS